ncbi:hypothetical protein HBB16_12135 [Pseudonocardia sp. MCCB 268]|nr:hypothetical protein [Pseudonocardia cytotoxica]
MLKVRGRATFLPLGPGGHRPCSSHRSGDDQRARRRGDVGARRSRSLTAKRAHPPARREVIHYDPWRSTWLCSTCRRWRSEPPRFTLDLARVGDDVIIVGYPLDGPYTQTPGKIRDNPAARPDI